MFESLETGLVRSLPPLHDLAGMAGIDLPEYLGQVAEEAAKKGAKKARRRREEG